jgi:hypothetical protein
MVVSRWWFLFCLAWACLGGTILYLIDRSLIGSGTWLLVGVLMGCLGRFFLERFIEIIPHRAKHLPGDPFFLLPVVGRTGIFLGPLIGGLERGVLD